MNNWGKAATVLAAIIAVACCVAWIELAPRAPTRTDHTAGSLGHAVYQFCDPARQGMFTGDDLERALACRDLSAQNDMALSTQRVVWLGWAQILVSIAGSAIVIWTVLVALHSAKLTRNTFEHQQLVTRLQFRPRLMLTPIAVTTHAHGGMDIEFRFRNIGVLPARQFRHEIRWVITPMLNGENKMPLTPFAFTQSAGIVAKDNEAGKRLRLPAASAALITSGTHALQIAYIAIFDDELGGRYRHSYTKELSTADLSHDRAVNGFKFSSPSLKGRKP